MLPTTGASADKRPRPFVAASEEATELTPAEAAEVVATALKQAKKAKYAAQISALYFWRIENPHVMTAEELYQRKLQQALQEEPRFSLDHGNLKQVFWQLCLYFTQDSRCTYDLSKGLLLQGNVGRGKTTLLKLFMLNPAKQYGTLAALKVCRMYQQEGPAGIAHLQGKVQNGLALDDLGTEPPLSNWFGNQANVLADILLSRYDLLKDGVIAGNETHLTTNLPISAPVWQEGEATLPGPQFVGQRKTDAEGQELPSLQLYYGNRVTDRFKEMFNQVVVQGAASLRK